MPSVRLRGLSSATKRLASGKVVKYWYAWRGGPRLVGAPGTPEFVASYNRAVEDRRTPAGETLAALVARYRASPEWKANAQSTRDEWSRWLDRISAIGDDPAIGDLTFEELDDRRVRAELLAWRDQWGDRPRAADYAVQVLSRVLSFGVDRGFLAINAAAGTEQLWQNNRADQIWTDDDLALFSVAAPSPEVGFIPWLACLTGFRREDLATVAWTHVGRTSIRKAPLKSERSGGAKIAIVPILPELRELLEEIRAQQVRRHMEVAERRRKQGKPEPPLPLTVLSTTFCKPWTTDGLEHQVVDTKQLAGVDKHLHDARGTFATRLRKADLSASRIADVMGWEEDRVERLLATYVDMDDIVQNIARHIAKNENGS